MFVQQWYPNKLAWAYTPADTNVHLVAFDSAGVPAIYDTMAAMRSASGRAFPGLPNNGPLGVCLIHSVIAASGLEGDEVYYSTSAINPPTVGEMENVLGNNHQQISLACPFQTLWIKMTNAADRLLISARY